MTGPEIVLTFSAVSKFQVLSWRRLSVPGRWVQVARALQPPPPFSLKWTCGHAFQKANVLLRKGGRGAALADLQASCGRGCGCGRPCVGPDLQGGEHLSRREGEGHLRHYYKFSVPEP